jgi:antitoxin component of MazEF toxin-antitoxin module
METINGAGGSMKLTQFDLGGHAAWRPAVDEYNCFAWMINQKRGGWFNPSPERNVNKVRSLTNCFFAFFFPLGLAAGLFVIQRSHYSEQLHERVYKRIVDILTPYRPSDTKVDDAVRESDSYRMWSGIEGAKQIKAKMVGFHGDNQVKMQSTEGKIVTIPINKFCTADQELLRKMQAEQPLPEGFRRWANHNGSQVVVAKFAGFQSDGKALLQSPAGKTLAVPINQLGQAEQEFLAKQQEQSALPYGFREWNNLSGTRKIIAKLLGFQEDKARLQLQNGQLIVTPIGQFSAEDQVLLNRLMGDSKPPT